MIVLCTGMLRSGSTWSYNVVKMLLKQHSELTHSGYSDDIALALRSAGTEVDHIVVKAHDPDVVGRALIRQNACKTVYTYRNPLDVIASAIEAMQYDFDKVLVDLRLSLDLLLFQLEAGDAHFIWYDEMIEYPEQRIAALADYLEIEVADEVIYDIAKLLDRENVRKTIRGGMARSALKLLVGKSKSDLGSAFSSHHIRDNPKSPTQLLTVEQRQIVMETLETYLEANGELRELVKSIGRIMPAPEPLPPEEEPLAPEPEEAEFEETAEAEDAPLAAAEDELLEEQYYDEDGEEPEAEPEPEELTIAGRPKSKGLAILSGKIELPPGVAPAFVEIPSTKVSSVVQSAGRQAPGQMRIVSVAQQPKPVAGSGQPAPAMAPPPAPKRPGIDEIV